MLTPDPEGKTGFHALKSSGVHLEKCWTFVLCPLPHRQPSFAANISVQRKHKYFRNEIFRPGPGLLPSSWVTLGNLPVARHPCGYNGGGDSSTSPPGVPDNISVTPLAKGLADSRCPTNTGYCFHSLVKISVTRATQTQAS